MSRSDSEKGIPVISEEDLDYLSSLTAQQLDSLCNDILVKLGPDASEKLEEKRDENYIFMFEYLGGHEGMDKYNAFFEAYLLSDGGEDDFYRLLPVGLQPEQEKIYAIQAVYIDRMARPIYNRLTRSRGRDVSLKGFGNDTVIALPPGGQPQLDLCKRALQDALKNLGYDIGVDVFIDVVSDVIGLGIPEFIEIGDDIMQLHDVYELWEDYKNCKGRFW